jgi:hypothetical protein
MKIKKTTEELTLVAIVLLNKQLPKYLYQKEASFSLTSRDR